MFNNKKRCGQCGRYRGSVHYCPNVTYQTIIPTVNNTPTVTVAESKNVSEAPVSESVNTAWNIWKARKKNLFPDWRDDEYRFTLYTYMGVVPVSSPEVLGVSEYDGRPVIWFAPQDGETVKLGWREALFLAVRMINGDKGEVRDVYNNTVETETTEDGWVFISYGNTVMSLHDVSMEGELTRNNFYDFVVTLAAKMKNYDDEVDAYDLLLTELSMEGYNDVDPDRLAEQLWKGTL